MNSRFWLFAVGFLLLLAWRGKIIQGFEGFKKPTNFPEPVYDFKSNTVTQEGFELGRKLFYEPRLSRNNTISCGSCHIQNFAFTHHGHDISHGIDDRLGTRNSPPIMNLAWSKVFFWDGGVFYLDLQPLVPITTHAEMDERLSVVIEKLKKHPEYPGIFKKVFGSEEITSAKMMKALSQFMVMCISSNSKYDKVTRKEGAVFTPEEQKGYTIFKKNCATCHKEPLFTDDSFRNNGITPGLNNDMGRFMITLDSADAFKFKVPSLRNIEFTGPYMHDGRFYDLGQVIDHYRFNVEHTMNLDPLLDQNHRHGFQMTDEDKANVIAFLKTLSDKEFLLNPLLSEQQ
ncbi:MAG: cytochrome c peroxidase [Chitinophagaceae bacterium]